MQQDYRFAEAVQEPSTGLFYRASSSATPARARLLLLHGVGSNEANLAGLAAALPPGLEILLLRGPLQLGPQGFAWYQVTFTSEGPSFKLEQAEASRQLLQRFIGTLPELPTVIAGFSQGGIMSASLGLTEPELFKGFALLSGRMLREIEPQIASPARRAGISAFIAHGRRDNVLPAHWAEEADGWLERLGVAHQTRYYDMAHEIIAEELADFAQWLAATLAL